MNPSIFRIGFLLAVILAMIGCSTPQPMTSFTPQDLDTKISSGEYQPKVDSFVVVLDASSSMGEAYKGQVHTGQSKFTVAKDLVHRMNVTMPAMPIQGGMTAFGLNPSVSKYPTETVWGPDGYTEAGLEQGLNAVAVPGGTTPMGLGIARAREIMKTTSGNVAVILFSDGEENTITTTAIQEAKEFFSEYGSRICLHTVFVGNTEAGRQLMSDLAAATECGMSKSAEDIASSEGMAAFVEDAFLELAPPPPPAAPMPQPKISWILSGVNFDFDSDVVRADAKEILKSDIRILQENPQIRVEIQGHTCDLGPADYNLELSDRRAKSIKAYLVSQGIDEYRLEAKGYGEANPRFPNDTEENRKKNRRVELVPLK